MCSTSFSSTCELDGLAPLTGGESPAESIIGPCSETLSSAVSMLASKGPRFRASLSSLSCCRLVSCSKGESIAVRPSWSNTSTRHCPDLSSSGGQVVCVDRSRSKDKATVLSFGVGMGNTLIERAMNTE